MLGQAEPSVKLAPRVVAVVALVAGLLALSTTPAAVTKVGNFAGTIIYPAAITGTVNDWTPADLGSATTIMVSLSGATTLTSLTGGANGRRIDLCNTGSFLLTLPHDTGGTAANRFYLADATSWTLGAAGMSCASFVYDSTASRWRMDAKTGTSFPMFTANGSPGQSSAGTTAVPTGSFTINGGAHSIQTYRAGGQDTILTNRADGTLAVPTAVQSGEELGELDFDGYNGTSYVAGASIAARTAETWTLAARGTQWEFNSTPIGSTTTTIAAIVGPGQRMSIGTGVISSAVNQVVIGPTSGTYTAKFGGHIVSNQSNVTFSSCGTGPACNSTHCSDLAGTFTTGSVTTTCTITFNKTYTGANDAGCIIEGIGITTIPTFTTTATTLVASVIIASTKYHYNCIGH